MFKTLSLISKINLNYFNRLPPFLKRKHSAIARIANKVPIKLTYPIQRCAKIVLFSIVF